jgi:signal transduction histidine kinase
VVTFLVFTVIYSVVHIMVYRHLDSEITSEGEEVLMNIRWKNDSLILNLLSENLEREHQQAEVSPTFLQVVDARGRLAFSSDNLLNDHLLFADSLTQPEFFSIVFKGKLIRQGQFPIINEQGKVLGQVDIGLPQGESTLVLDNLGIILCIAFPLMLLVLYFATYWAASRGIAPVIKLIRATGKIGDRNIHTRISLPGYQDEIFLLASTLNDLLARIEVSLNREKQITADISHELRTPVTSIRGMLEVLTRKTREPAQYEEKIKQVLLEVESLNRIIDQMLQLSRIDAGNLQIVKSSVYLARVIYGIKERWQQRMIERNIVLKVDIPKEVTVLADNGFLEIIIENLIGNAVKYGMENDPVICGWNSALQTLSITNNGTIIPKEQLPYLFNRFYRTDDSRSSQVQGHGLGLSIAKNLADLQQITIGVTSEQGKGTTFTLDFSN